MTSSNTPNIQDQGTQDMDNQQPTTNTTPTQEPVVEVKSEQPLKDFDALVSKLLLEGTQNQKTLVKSLQSYITNMAPGKPIGINEGAKQQYYLWKSISSIAESAPVDEFKKLWNILLAFFENYKDHAFHDRYVFRFSEYWSWSDIELTAFQRILNIIKLTSNANTRDNCLKNVDLDRSLAVGFSDEARQRITTFYKG